MKKYIYLAGPVTGRSKKEVNAWRDDFAAHLAGTGLVCINPMRCAPEVDESAYQPSYEGDECFGSARAIFSKNFFDVQNCDMVVAYLPTQSIGTIMEIGWASALGIPVILVSENTWLRQHPMLDQAASWKVKTLGEAMEIVVGIMGAYLRG